MTEDSIDDMTLSTTALADLLGLTVQRVGQLQAAGVLVKTGRGQYALAPSIRGYVAFLRGSDETKGLDYKTERTRLVRLQADTMQLELDKARGTMASIEDMVKPFGDACAVVRNHILALPSRYSPQLVGLETKQINKILTQGVREILDNLTTDMDMRAKADEAGKGEP